MAKPWDRPVEFLLARARAKGVTPEQLQAFQRNVERLPSGCWKWVGHFTNTGFPIFAECPTNTPATKTTRQLGRRLKVKQPMAHRTSFYWFKGILRHYPEWKLVQTCGHKWCVHPAHLHQVRVDKPQPIELHTDTLQAVFSRIQLHRPTGCWIWTGDRNTSGYPVLEMGGHKRALDVLIYAWFRHYQAGESESTHLPLHDCKVRACLNPAHMKLVPTMERRQKARVLAGPTQPTTEETHGEA